MQSLESFMDHSLKNGSFDAARYVESVDRLKRHGFLIVKNVLDINELATIRTKFVKQLSDDGVHRTLRLDRDYPNLSLADVLPIAIPRNIHSYLERYFDDSVAIIPENTVFRRHRVEDQQYHVTFHQDGKFISYDDCLVVWIPLDDCGMTAPGLELVIGDHDELLEVSPAQSVPGGLGNLYDSINIDENKIRSKLGHSYETLIPNLEVGDAVFLTPFSIHRTHVIPEMDQERVALVVRVVGQSAASKIGKVKLIVPLSLVTSDKNDNAEDRFTFDKARDYWKFVPTNLGKISTEKLLELDDSSFVDRVNDYYHGRDSYYWEDVHLVEYFSRLFSGKRILSFGSGMGHNETKFLEHGAYVTCADIVASNLAVIQRSCKFKGLNNVITIYMDDSSSTTFDGPYDFIFARGSLHHMPFEMQVRTVCNFVDALDDNGMIILNLYSDDFKEKVGNFSDPRIFALATDPIVEGLRNPWSEAYGDEKILELCGNKLHICYKQKWNNDFYTWWGLKKGVGEKSDPPDPPYPPFLDLRVAERAKSEIVIGLTSGDFELVGGNEVSDGVSGFLVVTDESNYGYVMLATNVQDRFSGVNRRPESINLVEIDVEIIEGGISIGILDQVKDEFVQSFIIEKGGVSFHHVKRNSLPREFSVILSNFSPNAPRCTKFNLNGVNLSARR